MTFGRKEADNPLEPADRPETDRTGSGAGLDSTSPSSRPASPASPPINRPASPASPPINRPTSPASPPVSRPTRLEHDLLGQLPVPTEAYYGIHTVRAIANFQISGRTINEIPSLIVAFAYVKKAAAAANRDLGVLPRAKAVAIIAACDQIIGQDAMRDQFPIDVFQGGAGTSLNMNANEVIANLALELMGRSKGDYSAINPNDDVNMSQSTNDAYPTAFRLAVLHSTDDLLESLADLEAAFADKAKEFAAVLKMGRTQLQDAVPMTLGQEFSAFATLVAEERRHLSLLSQLLLEVNLGATAIGTGVNTPRGYPPLAVAHLSEYTGRAFVLSQNLVEATSDCGAYVSVHAALKRIAVKLGKISNDLRLLSSGPRAGLMEINLPERAAGSSIMPAKVNPIIPEVVNQVAFKVMGNDVALTMAAEAGQLQLNAMEPVIAQNIFESIALLTAAADTLRSKCVVGITANPAVTRHYVDHSIGLVTFLNLVLGHELCDEIGRQAHATGQSVRQVVLERGLLDEAKLDELLSPDRLLAG
ncbi:MAG: aspartate ammonia-lyase [Propionibacteriaceae bacterium]|jgi:aspartate ammonia-lyase|nr:aspartate ammonia-lyase [Propionibacteriaceae bacterium]